MAENKAGNSDTDVPLSKLFEDAMKSFQQIENDNTATNNDSVQLSIKSTIAKLEKITNFVSASDMFSRNENVEELPTDSLQYLLLPALLGTLHLKLTTQSNTRKEIIEVAEVYFRDYLQRCNDYGLTQIEIPQPAAESQSTSAPVSEAAKIANMVGSREAKIKRYKEQKELKMKLEKLRYAILSPSIDDEVKREYFITLIQNFANQALDELHSIDQEKPILEYMSKHADGKIMSEMSIFEPPAPKKEPARKHTPLKPVIITRDAVQKAVFGQGYPALPTLTIEEFYDQRVREGTFPGSCNIPHSTIHNADDDPDEAENIRKENLVETEDPEELARQRNMDEYKDTHRRGWGNRHNRS